MKKILSSLLILVLLTSCNTPSVKKFTEINEGTITNLYDAFSKDTLLTKEMGFSCITKYGSTTNLMEVR